MRYYGMGCYPTPPHKLSRKTKRVKRAGFGPIFIRNACALGKSIFIAFLRELAVFLFNLQFGDLGT